ncbi:hypothetical protein LX81_00715 [Palleronia aestuarii]|uniref:Phytase-like domain-containing protein n=1 Tax=Palleronia aestuarii TaxID=568105 RepID=A0A2W7NGM4_9RHOB|nr:esterase-like activity of phytase family protein [Palleronia aestuarii]PZX19020.1 hypothetical protein LX81_00715 [Palleronia aestuarii]
MPSRPRALILACLLILGAPARGAEFVGDYTWRLEDPNFGGFSGLDIAANGIDFTAISDRSSIVSGRLLREDGHIVGAKIGPILPLLNTDGTPMTTAFGDSEGLAVTPDGRIYVSFEHRARVWSYETPGGKPSPLPRPRDFNGLGSNSSLEALAIDADGALYTMPEVWRDREAEFPIWRFRNGRWTRPYMVPKRDSFRPVGADFDDRGRLYILERYFSGLGFASRVRRFTLGSEGIETEETLLESRTGQHDNLEGVSVWRDGDGGLRVTMISDDNFRFFQRTEFVEYSVPD